MSHEHSCSDRIFRGFYCSLDRGGGGGATIGRRARTVSKRPHWAPEYTDPPRQDPVGGVPGHRPQSIVPLPVDAGLPSEFSWRLKIFSCVLHQQSSFFACFRSHPSCPPCAPLPGGFFRGRTVRCARAVRKVGHSPPPVGSFLGVGLPQGTIAIVYPCSINPPPPLLACMYPSPPLGDRGRSPSLHFLSVYFFRTPFVQFILSYINVDLDSEATGIKE